MAEDDRADAEGAASGNREGGLGVHLRGGGLQSGADAKVAGQPGWCGMSQGSSVPERGQSGQKGPQIDQVTLLRRSSGVRCLRSGTITVANFAEKRRFSAAC